MATNRAIAYQAAAHQADHPGQIQARAEDYFAWLEAHDADVAETANAQVAMLAAAQSQSNYVPARGVLAHADELLTLLAGESTPGGDPYVPAAP